MRLHYIAVLLALLVSATPPATAQERFGALSGIVTDTTNAAVPGATVTVTNKATGAVRTAVSTGDGSYQLPDLEPGRYTVTVELQGFQKVQADDVLILLGRTATFPARLQVGALSETVTVTADAVQHLDLTSSTVQHNVTAEEIDRLPKARSFQALALTAPSVNSGEIEGGIQVNGASGAENAYTVDGVVTNSLVNGKSRQDTVFEYLQEVQVKTTGIAAEYGGALGGVISAVTKSGGNSTHGEAHYYFYGSPLSAASGQRLNLDPSNERTVRYVQDAKQQNNNNEVGGSLGGPIARNRLFYFGAYSPRLRRAANEYQFSNGAERGQIKQSQTYTQAFGKLTFSNDRLTASGSVLYTPTRSTGTLPSYQGAGANFITSSLASNAININRGFEQDQTNANGQLDIPLSHVSFLSVRGGYFWLFVDLSTAFQR